MDDALQLTDPQRQADTILEVIKMKNRCPYKLNMAALDAKVHSYFASKFVFLTTNVNNVVCDKIADIGAFYRRIDFDVFVAERPIRKADGTPSFDYKMKVNGEPCDIPTLADSIVALYNKNILNEADISRAIADFVLKSPPADVIIPARNSTRDLSGRETNRANGLAELFFQSPYSPLRLSCLKMQTLCTKITQDSVDYVKWLAVAAVGVLSLTSLSKLCKSLTVSLFPNSRKVKDQLTGDKPSKVSTTKSDLRDQLKAVQAKVDKVAVKQVHKIKSNGSSDRWAGSMVSYIMEQGWSNQQWIADSLASIEPLDDFDCSEQELSDLNRLRSNVVDIFTYYEYNDEVIKLYGKALILNENHVITTSHQIPQTCKIVNIEISLSGKIVNVRNSKLDRIENSDTCVLTLPTVLPHRDISYMFSPLSEVTSSDSELYLLRNFDETMTICPCFDFKPIDRQISYNTDCNEVIHCGSSFECKVAVCPGDSGCFYVSRDRGRFKIVGMHIASSFYSANGRFISREMLKSYLAPPRVAVTPYESIKEVVQENSRSFDHILAANSNCVSIGIVHPRTMISSRSKLNRSLLYKHRSLPPPTELPVNLKRTYDEQDPLLKSNIKFRLRDDPVIDTVLRNEIIHALMDEFPNTKTNVIYTNAQAIEGTAEMPHLTMNTSSGYPYSAVGKTPKTKLTPEDWKQVCIETDDLLEDLYNGHMPQTIYQTSFKDETRPPPKVNTPRVVNCASLKITLLFRRVLGPLMNLMHANYSKLEMKVGINAHGDDWKTLFQKLCDISSENIVELDYSGFEYNHPPFAFVLAADLVYLLYLRSGFSQRDAKAARLLILSCAGGYVLQNDVLIFVWMLLSGLPITAELNSILNKIYQMICFKRLTNIPLIEMRKYVCSAYYGDDLLHAVADSIRDKFNAITIQKCCEEFLLMKVTPAANKTGELQPFIDILECSFLCRKFCPRDNRVDAPLRLSASTDSLQYYIPVSHMTQRELISAKCRSFLTELTHYPQEIYEHWASILSSMKAQFDLGFICYDYSTALSRRIANPYE
jgi:hypothetical protein